MATGMSRYEDYSARANDIQESSLFVLRSRNVLARTVTTFTNSQSMDPRIVERWTQSNFRQVGAGDDITPTQFTHELVSTLTPVAYMDQFLIHDHDVRSNWDNVRAAASRELGGGAATLVDTQIATNFGSLTAGTVGSAGSALTWANIFEARAILEADGVMGPYWCPLHPYQWLDLQNSPLTSGSELTAADEFNNELLRAYYKSNVFGDVFFAICGNIAIDSSDDATGAMYSSLALAYDQRQAFKIAPQRDESRRATELNASLDFATGTWDPTQGVQIISDATAP